MATISVVFDFDGTLVTSFIGGLLFRGFTPEAELKKASNRFKTNVTSLREYQEEVFDLVSESTAEMSKRAVEGASIRSQAHEVCEHIWNVGGKVAVASAGLDFYIQPVLDNSKLGRINVHSGKVISNVTELPPFRYDYPSSDDQCEGDWITCKCKVINDMKSEDEEIEVVFVGDGTGPDECAAKNAADTVFARGRLLSYCIENQIPAMEFGEDFGPVLSYVVNMTSANGAQ